MPRRSCAFVVSAMSLAAALIASPSAAQEQYGLVSRVISGDRVVFRAPDQEMTVELAGVRAPAPGKPLADASRSTLAHLCLRQAATLTQSATATDGTVVGQLSCAGKDAAIEQVRLGMAEVRAPQRNTLMLDALHEAKRARRGLWAD